MKPHPKRAEIRTLREQGCSYREITEQTGASKSTISYIVKDITLSPNQKNHLLRKRAEGARKGRNTMTPEQKRRNGRKGGKALWEKNPEAAKANLEKAVVASALTYLPGELVAKVALERIYGETFKKEKVAGYYFDFSSQKFLIEHTLDGKGKGVRAAITRFAAVRDDPREKHFYVDTTYLGEFRQRELHDLSVEVHDVRELINGE